MKAKSWGKLNNNKMKNKRRKRNKKSKRSNKEIL